MSYLDLLADIVTLDEAGLLLFPPDSNDSSNPCETTAQPLVGEDEGFIPLAA